MKTTLPILALLTGHMLAADSPVPTAFSADRYEKMIDKSPFALATPVVAPPAPQANFAANWYLTGVGRDEQGQDFVTIAARDQSVHFSLTGRDAHIETGVALASVNWADGYKKSSAIIKKGTETAKLEFSQDETVAMPQPGIKPGGPGGLPPIPVTTRPVVGGQPQTPVTQQPRISLPRPGGPSVIAQPVVTPPGGQPGGAPEGENRRRVRNIAAPGQ